jgi:hypothetical protein
MEMPDLADLYREEVERHGHQGAVFFPDEQNSMLFVDEDPERAWPELAPYFLREAREYAGWRQEGVPRPGEQDVADVEGLRAQKRYEILTPEDCIERIRASRGSYTPCLHPLVGGIPLERAWRSLELYTDRVLSAFAPPSVSEHD